MATEVKIPELGESISSGILAIWHVSDGDIVKQGQSLFDLETDKITSEGTAEASGKIELKVAEGDEVEVGAIVAVIDEGAAEEDSASDAQENGKNQKTDQETDSAEQEGEAAPEAEQADSDEDGEKEEDSPSKDKDYPLSPAVRRAVEETGVDPSKVKGSGKDGRLTKKDIVEASKRQDTEEPKDQDQAERAPAKERESSKEEAAATAREKKPPKESQTQEPADDGRQTRKRMTPLRRTIAARLVQAKNTTAMLTTFNEVDMSAVMDLRKKHQDSFVDNHGIKLGFMSFFIKASVYALKAVPEINAQIDGDFLVRNHFYDIGVAVSTDRGLLVPVVRQADSLGFAELETQIVDFAKRARDGKIGIDELQGGVFTITNGGIFGSLLSTPILNLPQSAILGMHTIKERPVAVDGQVVIRPMMYLALSYDHRVIDGREAVTFLGKIKDCIEDPIRLLFDI